MKTEGVVRCVHLSNIWLYDRTALELCKIPKKQFVEILPGIYLNLNFRPIELAKVIGLENHGIVTEDPPLGCPPVEGEGLNKVVYVTSKTDPSSHEAISVIEMIVLLGGVITEEAIWDWMNKGEEVKTLS